MTKKVVFWVLGVVSHILALFFGAYLATLSLDDGYGKILAFNTFSRYELSRDIAGMLKEQNYNQAKCRADLDASSGFDYVSDCMQNEKCAAYIGSDVQERAPEFIGENKSVGFDYIAEVNGIRRCN